MTLTIELPDELESALQAQATAEGISTTGFVRRMLEQALTTVDHSSQPLETGRGMLAKYGPAPSAEEIDANRAEMFRNFGQDL